MNTNHRVNEDNSMKKTKRISFVGRVLNNERGQILPMVALGMVGLIAMGGLTMDVGRAYVVRSQAQSSTNAAALAAVGPIYSSDPGAASTLANQYAALNPIPGVSQVNGYPKTTTLCVNMMMVGTTCAKNNNIPNAVQVVERVTVPTYFMKILGVSTLTVSATATASPGNPNPWNLAFIVDTTPSMNSNDNNCGGITALKCALNGAQSLLGAANPCKGVPTCNNTTANFHVALFSFPNISTTDAPDDYNCGGTPAYQPYSLPVIGLSGYTPITYTFSNQTTRHHGSPTTTTNAVQLTYQSTYGATDADANGFFTNYYDSSAPGNLSSTSSIVKAIGHGTTNPCLVPPSSQNAGPSGGVTYFAGALYAAQAALIAERDLMATQHVTTQDGIIIISDGQANLDVNGFPAGWASQNGYKLPTTVSSNGLLTLTGTGAYPDSRDACQQAMLAANYATTNGTTVFSIAYGSELAGCLYGNNGNLGGVDSADVIPNNLTVPLNISVSSLSQVVPCLTMENMASAIGDFYSDYNQQLSSGSSQIDPNCIDASHNVSTLAGIFQAITSSLTSARLIPNNAI
jgi:Flp pilus assembly protein TadG